MSIRISSRVAILSIIALTVVFLPNLLLINPSSANTVSTTIARIYLDAPMVQGSYALRHGGDVQTFDGFSSNIESGTSITIGTVTRGRFVIGTSSAYGASESDETPTVTANAGSNSYPGSNYVTAESGTVVTFTTAVKYVGFHWQAGNDGNVVTFRSGSTDLASLTSTNIGNAIGTNLARTSYTNTNQESITATNGTVYLKKRYFGNPKFYTSLTQESAPSGTNTIYDGEPYAYVHAFAAAGESFDSIRFTGGGFELDNLVVSTQEVPIRDSLILNQTATTSLTLGTSAWNFKGVTTSDSSSVSTGWQSDSSTATTSPQISIQQDLSITSGSITMGATALFRATLTDSGGITCGTYSLVETYTATNASWEDITIADSGSSSRTRLVRGNCYAWTINPSSNYGTGAIRPTSSAANTRFNSNLDSPRLILPKLPDVKIPRTIPADPSKLSLSFPRTKVTQGPGQMQVCIFETSLSALTGWGTASGTQNLRFTSGALTGSPLIATSTNAIQNLFDNLRIQRINSTRFSTNRYVLIRLAPYLGSGFTTDCVGSGSENSVTFSGNLWPRQSDTFLIHLKPISLTQIRTFIIQPKNGRQP